MKSSRNAISIRPKRSKDLLVLSFGRTLKSLRLRRRMTQGTLARRMPANRCYISLVEKGHREPSIEFVSRYCQCLRVPPEIFLLCAAQPTEAMSEAEKKIFAKLRTIAESYLKTT